MIEATLIRTDQDSPTYPSFYVYTLLVNQVFRGKTSGTIYVYEGNDSGRAGFDWVTGRKYLLFLFYSTREKSLELDGCGNSGPLSGAGTALSEIAAIKAARGSGVIHGVVGGSERVPGPNIPGVQVEAEGTTGRYTATTNEKGEFQISVPAGQYVLRAFKNGMTFGKALFSYEDPRRVQIEAGGCAQIEFAEVEHPPAP